VYSPSTPGFFFTKLDRSRYGLADRALLVRRMPAVVAAVWRILEVSFDRFSGAGISSLTRFSGYGSVHPLPTSGLPLDH